MQLVQSLKEYNCFSMLRLNPIQIVLKSFESLHMCHYNCFLLHTLVFLQHYLFMAYLLKYTLNEGKKGAAPLPNHLQWQIAETLL